ncbi:MAG TPA: phosphoglycerate kinase [Stellaceae bacterium]|nr:phosphoglycerate kinase [Stellaceae bacterium]
MARFSTLDDIDVHGKTVLLRADLNVPMKDGRILDATRLTRLVPGVRRLIEGGAKVVVMSHFDRPGGKPDPKFSLRPLVSPLASEIGGPVAFAADCVGPEARRVVEALRPGEVALLENLRFHAGEEKNDPAFARSLAVLGDLYVNDAFSAAHRAHASTEGIAHLLPAYAGPQMAAELAALASVLEHPKRPVAALIGGAKVSTKLALIDFILTKARIVIIGGAMANTLLAARGIAIGTSLVERDLIPTAEALLKRAESLGTTFMLPIDVVVAPRLAAGVPTATLPVEKVPADRMILDIGPASVAAVAERLETCRTLVWNGPVGAFETAPFDAGTTALARKVAALTRAGTLTSVAGGGDTVAALVKAGEVEALSYVSTAGGAFLEWLEGRELPGVAALRRG